MSDRDDHATKFTYDEPGEVTISGPEQCSACRHYHGGVTCDAFPDLIPPVILAGDHDHREPYPGDNGIRFAPKDE